MSEKLKAFLSYCAQPKNKWDAWDFSKALLLIGCTIAMLMYLIKTLFY